MIRLATLIEQFEHDYLAQYGERALPSHLNALRALKTCRSSTRSHFLALCRACDQHVLIPHSCGHRACPHCQHHEAEKWLARQQQ